MKSKIIGKLSTLRQYHLDKNYFKQVDFEMDSPFISTRLFTKKPYAGFTHSVRDDVF